jgi:hypothetical protein
MGLDTKISGKRNFYKIKKKLRRTNFSGAGGDDNLSIKLNWPYSVVVGCSDKASRTS